MKLVSDLRLLLVGLWLGAAIFFIVAAQSAMAIIPSRDMVWDLIASILPILNKSGMAVGVLLLLTSLIPGQMLNASQAWAERILALAITLACGIGEFVFGTMLDTIRSVMRAGNTRLEQIPINDPLRSRFDAIHEYSTWSLIVAMVAAFLVFFIISGKHFNSPKIEKMKV